VDGVAIRECRITVLGAMRALRISSLLVALGGLLVAAACARTTTQREGLPPLETVEHVDLPSYLGTWYEIASYPQRFQTGCTATTANYSLRNDGLIRVINRCHKGWLDGELDQAKGIARVVDKATNAKLEVSFFRPFWGEYWIIDLDDEYQWAVVGHPSRDYLWILSREPQLDDAVYEGILDRLREQHYDTSRLVRTVQPD
jgi:apolipoprotein D and lipocalin family protein